MKKFYKNFPIETYILLLPSIIFLFFIGIYLLFYGFGYAESFFHGHFLSLILTANLIFPIIFLIVILNIIKILFMVKDKIELSYIINFIKSSLFVLGIFYISLLALSVLTQFILNVADPVRTAASSIMFTNWDYAIFGAYPWLSLHSFITAHWLQKFIYESYVYTPHIMLVLLIILALKNSFLFRKFLLSYCIAILMGIPFWIIFPALAPDMMYRMNILNVPIESKLKENLDNTNFSKITKTMLRVIEKTWVDSSAQSLPVTSFPSMHSAWGIIVTVIGIELWAPLAIVLVPWVLAELTGTILTLEHYAVDTILGIILGFLSLYMASRLLKFDMKNSFDKWDLFLSLRELQTSLKKASGWIKDRLKNFLS